LQEVYRKNKVYTRVQLPFQWLLVSIT